LRWEKDGCTGSVNTKPKMDLGLDTKCLLKDNQSICWNSVWCEK
jgi:hypothetical protein